ncbi:glycosyltransferase family 39 protein [Candidatus Daviesbacteria bacterium]|nr:glycosyltransferase family 39 protein [Candidatus Daviesbacteria bacterium]
MKDLNLHLLVKTLLYWYIFIFISTEILSYFRILERMYIFLAESFFWIFFLFLYRNETIEVVRSINFYSKKTLALLILFSLTFVQGFSSAPNSADSMVYHLPRIMYWVQEKTLFQDVIRNVHDYMPPFGHYILLHLYLIFGNDRFLFFSQWSGYVTTVVISGLIARNLGANRQISGLTSLLVATIPVAVLQATNTTVDMVVTVLVVLSTYLALRLNEPRIFDYILLSFSLGLGVLTKQIFLIYFPIPIGIILVKFLTVNKRQILSKGKKILMSLLIGFSIIILIQARFISQNLAIYGHIAGAKVDYLGQSTQVTFVGIFSNLIKNTMLNIPLPLFAKEAENVILSIHKLIGIDINECSTTFCDEDFKFRIVRAIYPQEDIASNSFHLLLIVVAGIILLKQFINKRVNYLEITIYSLALLSYVLFSTLVKWQPFHSRLQMPFFVIGTIPSVLVLSKFKRGLIFVRSILYLSVFLALLLIFLNVLRPYVSYNLFYESVKSYTFNFRGIPGSFKGIPESFFSKPRTLQYFNSRPYYLKPYIAVINSLSDKNTKASVAFDLSYGFEYPLWHFLKEYNLNYKIVPNSKKTADTIIISTQEKSYKLLGYYTECFKTDVEIQYSYVCISKPDYLRRY